MFDSVRTRLTLWYVGVLALALLIFSAGIYALLARDLNERLDNSLRDTLTLTTDSLKRDLAEDLAQLEDVAAAKALTESEAEHLIERETAHGSIEDLKLPNQAIAIFDAQGRLLAEDLASDQIRAALPTMKEISNSGSIHLFTTSWRRGEKDDRLRSGVQRVQGTMGKFYWVVAAQSLKENAEQLRTQRQIFYIAVPVALSLAGIAGFFLADQFLKPLRVMSEGTRRISAENLKERLPVANPRDELGKLAATFNELLARLNASFEQQRQLVADTSHELRTPLSVMHTTAEVILGQAQRTEQEYRDALVMIDAHTRRLTRIVKDMLTLTRADAGRYPLQRNHCYLNDLICEAAHTVQVLAASKTVRVDIASPTDTPFYGDEDLLRQMVLNLIDNAVKHTPSGGNVRISLEQDDSVYTISIADSGSGISKEAQPYIFDRFYRADKARSRNQSNGEGGAGLGLSIALWIAEAHNGELKLLRSDENGSIFIASLPKNLH